VARTQDLMADTTVPAIFEATFSFQGVLVRVDILQRRPGNRWRLIEAKSTTRVKDEHYRDVAIQKYVSLSLSFTELPSCSCPSLW
jgi:predicted RecB family nuclease